ncbi:substrate-binding domain-containing protein [Marinospirillum sp. MEB164]|uniref:Substrate-binding domain-containing protein n=1 Tax=Marinospirillum alkalitolerans TaxID=3123374 RepID=A0ABW8PW89_9GAMM
MTVKKKALALALTAAASVAMALPAMARDTIQIAGSSTVLPFSSIVAEEFGNNFAQFRTPVVGSGGSGGGLRQFCQGVGANTIDIANSSRPIRPNELENCRSNGVTEIIEVMFGYDGIVFASRRDSGSFALEPRHVFLAGAAEIYQNGQRVRNPYTRWSQIDSSLPDQEILLVIPGSNHGTREVYEETVVHPGCAATSPVSSMSRDQRTAFCDAIRTDGRVVEVAGDYTETLARLDAQRNALGVFGLSFYDQNRDRLQVATMSGVTPTLETISSGEYPVSRPLYFYVKNAHVGVIPGLLEYTQFFLSEEMGGTGSVLEDAGLIPMSSAERREIQTAVRNRTIMR